MRRRVSASVAPDRRPCPVATCRNTVPSGQVMCVACWEVLPAYVRQSVAQTALKAGRHPTAHSKAARDQARDSAVRIAAGLRS